MVNDYFRLYAKELLTDLKLSTLTGAQIGAAVKLWALSWVNGPLPSDPVALTRLVALPDVGPGDITVVVAALWVCSEDGAQITSARLEEERDRTEKSYNAKVSGGRKAWKRRKLQSGGKLKHNSSSTEQEQTYAHANALIKSNLVVSSSNPENISEQHTEEPEFALTPQGSRRKRPTDPVMAAAVSAWEAVAGPLDGTGKKHLKLAVGAILAAAKVRPGARPARVLAEQGPEHLLRGVIQRYVKDSIGDGYTPSPEWLRKRYADHLPFDPSDAP